MKSLIEITNKAIADYGFRQVVLWSPDDVVTQWDLAQNEADVLTGSLRDALEALPVPVEPEDLSAERERFAKLIGDGLAAK